MITYLKKLLDERDQLTATQNGISEAATAAERDLNDTEKATVANIQTRCAELDEQIKTYSVQAESQREYARIKTAATKVDAVVEDRDGAAVARTSAAVTEQDDDWMAPFARSAELASWSGKGTSPRVECGSVLEERATITTGFPPSGYTTPFRWTGNVQTPLAVTPLLSICGTARVSSGAVDYAYTTPAPATAAPVVPENTAKPEAAFTINLKSATLQTFAHWKAATRQALDDIPGLQAMMTNYLRAGLQMAIEGGIATALAANPDIQDATGESMLAAARVGLATVQSAGRQPNALLLNPADWADIDLAILAGTVVGPNVSNSAWGLRIVSAPEVPAGTGYVGDFANGVTVFDRGVSNVYMTDSHADYFLSNVLVVLAETRALPAVTDAASIVKISVTAAP
jgi:HK97 family phage major capsid protein